MSHAITCPGCGCQVAPAGAFPTWCDRCEWGLVETAEPAPGFFARRFESRSARMVEAMYEDVVRSPARRTGWNAARIASYALALVVHAGTLSLVLLALWLVFAVPNVLTVALAAVALLMAFAVRPRFGGLRRAPGARYRADAPALFALLDRIAAEVGAKPVHAVIPDGTFNAGYAAVGVRRRRVLLLGLPLWEALSPMQKVAVLGHEFGHGVNGDSRHGLVVGTSLTTLERLRELFHPGPRDPRTIYIIHVLLRLVLTSLYGVLSAVLIVQSLLSLRANQRAEYYADALAARLAGPADVAGAFDVQTTTRDTYRFTVQRLTVGARTTDFWNEWHRALAALPESERERRRRVAARRKLRVDSSHPPTHLRIAVMQTLPAAEPALILTPAEEARIRAELDPDYTRIARRLRETATDRVYY
jgi:Zn-dependent protease with chaperone function